PPATSYSLARMLPLVSKMPTSRSSLAPEPYFRATPRVIECLVGQPLGAFRAMAWRWQPLCCWHAGAGGPSGSGWPGPTLPVYDAVPGAAPPTPTVGVPAANAVDAARPPEARSSESEPAVQKRAFMPGSPAVFGWLVSRRKRVHST